MIHYESIHGEDFTLPSKFVVCPKCQGNGFYVKPSIDGKGLPDHLCNNPEFMKGYMVGNFDAVCSECRGDRVIEVASEMHIHPDVYAKYTEAVREEHEAMLQFEAEIEAERRVGA